MENLNNKESYLQRKGVQLHQWERVINKLKLRVGKSKDKKNTDLEHHILKIQVIQARTEAKLRNLEHAKDGNWDDLNAGFEISWLKLRKAFLKASARPSNNNNR